MCKLSDEDGGGPDGVETELQSLRSFRMHACTHPHGRQRRICWVGLGVVPAEAHACRQAGRAQAGRQADRVTRMHADRQASRVTGRHA